MDAIQKIKAEIERKQQENLAQFNKGLINIETLTARDSQLLHIHSFIESLEKEPAPKIKGWVARGRDDELNFFTEKPRRLTCCWIGNGFCDAMILMEKFPDLKWEDNPIEVELIIKRV